MSRDQSLRIEERLFKLFLHLGIKRAHFAARVPTDWEVFAMVHPEIFSSLTLVCPPSIDSEVLSDFSSRLLVFTGDQGPSSGKLSQTVEGHPNATLVTLQDYNSLLWSDVVADRTEEVGSSMIGFLEKVQEKDIKTDLPNMEREVAGISFSIRGTGPPLVLLPLALAPSQWEPLLPRLSERYSTITLSGPELGIAARLEERGRTDGYLRVFRNLIDEVGLQSGEKVLEVGCGTGILTRWLFHKTNGENPIIGLDLSRHLLREAKALAVKEKLEAKIVYQEGSAEDIPFPDNSFDVTISSTVMEEVDADKMLAEMVRVTKVGGRVGVLVRSEDMSSVVNLPLRSGLKAKVEAPGFGGAGVGEKGCADSSLYRRFQQAGLNQVKVFPQLATFTEKKRLQSLASGYLSLLDPEEVKEWEDAVEKAEAEGIFFISQPVHSAVGIKP